MAVNREFELYNINTGKPLGLDEERSNNARRADKASDYGSVRRIAWRGVHGIDCCDPQPGECPCGAVNPTISEEVAPDLSARDHAMMDAAWERHKVAVAKTHPQRFIERPCDTEAE